MKFLSLRRGGLFALLVGVVAMLVTAASAQAAPIRQIQINTLRAPDGSRLVLEAQFDGNVLLQPAKTGFARQQWVQENSSFGGVTFRNQGFASQCLRDESPTNGRNLRVGSCFDLIGGRQRWKFAAGSTANTGVQLVNQATNLVPLVFTDDFNQFDITTALKGFASLFPDSSEWRLAQVGNTA
jgi:hypothetical protein